LGRGADVLQSNRKRGRGGNEKGYFQKGGDGVEVVRRQGRQGKKTEVAPE